MRVGYRLGLMVLLLNACASGRAMQAQDIPGGELPPPGYGSLKQDNVNLRMGSSDVELRFPGAAAKRDVQVVRNDPCA